MHPAQPDIADCPMRTADPVRSGVHCVAGPAHDGLFITASGHGPRLLSASCAKRSVYFATDPTRTARLVSLARARSRLRTCRRTTALTPSEGAGAWRAVTLPQRGRA